MAEAQLTIVDGPNAGRSFDLAGAAVLGRDTSAGIVLEDAEASRRHASISAEGATVTIEDLGSTNGTFVNGERLTGSRTLASGDKVRIGTTVLEVQLTADEQATRMAAPIPDPEATRMGQARPDFAAPETQAPPPAEQPPAPPAPPEPPPGGTDMPTPAPIPEPAPPAAGPPPVPEPQPGPPPPPAPEPEPVPPEPVAVGGPPPAPAGESFPPPPPPGGGFEQPGGAPPAPAFPPPAPPGAGVPPVAYEGAGGFAAGGYPVDVQAEYPHEGIARWRAFFQGFLLFPHFFVLFFYIIGVYFVLLASFFGTLFTGRWTPGFNYMAGFFRYAQRVGAYMQLMTEQYPPFDMGEHPEYPIRVRIDTPERIPRWLPLVSWLLALPHYFVLMFLGIGAYIALIGAWFSILFTRRYPPGIFNFVLGVQRWNLRVIAYTYWMRSEYPPFSLE